LIKGDRTKVLLWAIFAALTAAVLYALLRPLAGGGASDESRSAFNATVYRDQLGEVESDRERGLIGKGDAEAARVEIARRLLASDAEGNSASDASTRSSLRAVVLGLAVALPLAVLSLYLVYGSPRLPDQPLVARLQDPTSDKNLAVLVARVEARLRQHPEEGEGWEVIAPVYMGWRRYSDAAEAYRQSIRLLGESPKRLASYGQALVLANNGVVTEDARKALERAITLDPELIEPRLVLIIAKEQDGKLAEAVEEWRKLLASAPADAPWRKLVEQRLAEDEAKLAGKGSPAKPEAAEAAAPKGPSPEDVAAAESMNPGDRQVMIEAMVQRLADRLTQNGDDLAGWLKLVRAYTVLDRKDDALKALGKAKTQFSGNDAALRELDALASELGLRS
jgi:cytochrome c-type biogenesis protein CcmH